MQDENQAIIKAFSMIMPFLKDFFLGDAAMCISDQKKYTYYKAGKGMDHKIKPGDPIKAEGIADKCLKEKRTIIDEIDGKIFGFAYTAMAAPILNENREAIGVFIVLISIEMKQNRESLKHIAKSIADNMFVLNQNIDSLRNQSEYISSVSSALKQVSGESKEQVQETNDVLNLIKNIANKTNLLGINAAIEATRVGNEGAGFKVVSDEIRNLSVNTNDSIKKIEPIIKQVHINSDNISDKITDINKNALNIVDSINKVKDMSMEISDLCNDIDQLADNLLQSSKH